VFSSAAGASAALAFGAASRLSPSCTSTAIGVLTFTPCAPASTRILPSVPSSTASTSMVALSVSISAITSPADTLSPSFFSHFARLPSSMVGDSAGIRISTGITRLRKRLSWRRRRDPEDRGGHHDEENDEEKEECALERAQRLLHLRP